MSTLNLTHHETNLFVTRMLVNYVDMGLKHRTRAYVLRMGKKCGMGANCCAIKILNT
jgi:hypothetical protein